MRTRSKLTYLIAGGAAVLALQLILQTVGPVAFAGDHGKKSQSSVVLAPILEGQLGAWHEMLKAWGENPEGVLDFNKRYGLTRHAGWLAQTPDGPVAVVLHEGPGGANMLQDLATSDHEFDASFREQISKIHGIDFAAPPPGAPPALVFDSTQHDVVVHSTME